MKWVARKTGFGSSEGRMNDVPEGAYRTACEMAFRTGYCMAYAKSWDGIFYGIRGGA